MNYEKNGNLTIKLTRTSFHSKMNATLIEHRNIILMRFLFSCLLLITTSSLPAQNLVGITGLFNIPSAHVAPEGTLIFGAHIMDKDYGGFAYGRDPVYEWDALGLSSALSVLPWLEVQFRWTHSICRSIGTDPVYAPDRMGVLRIRILNGDSSWYPSITVGAEDPARFAGNSSPSYYASLYLVGTKKVEIREFDCDLTIGYGFDPEFSWMVGKAQFLRQVGWFGGLAIGIKNMPGSAIMIEYDSFRWNAGVRILFFQRLQILAGLYEMKAFSGGLSYRIKL